MTTYTHDPRLLESVPWEPILARSNDPIRRVGALLILSDGREFPGTNRIEWQAGMAHMEWLWKMNRNVGRGLVRHAEVDSIFAAVDLGVTNFLGATLIVTLSPCQPCRNLIEACGIMDVFYGEEYA